MKFAEHLQAHITPEWRKQYINYEEMKAMLYAAVERAPSPDAVDAEELTRYYTSCDEGFFAYCEKQLYKINTFYSEKLAEATRKFNTLKAELKGHMERYEIKQGKQLNLPFIPEDEPTRKFRDLKLAFSEFYLSLVLLQNYQNLNYTGFCKILKKHDKLLEVDTGLEWRSKHADTAHFHSNQDVVRIVNETELLVTRDLEGGDRQKAMKRLRVPPLSEIQSSLWVTFRVGFFLGAFIVLLVLAAVSILIHEEFDDWRTVLRLYRGPFLIVEFLFLMSINVYGWRTQGVNHVLIFELDPRNHLSEQNIMEIAGFFGVVWALSVICFMHSSALGTPQYIHPLILVIFMVCFLCNPTKTFQYRARFWTIKVLIHIILAPAFYVGFADFWLADQMNSLVTAFRDFYFLIFFYSVNNGDYETAGDIRQYVDSFTTTATLVSTLPAWYRFAQCLRRYRDTREAFPHLTNAGKYSTSFIVMLFSILTEQYKGDYIGYPDNPFFYCKVFASVLSTSYTYTWDIKVDWGLFEKQAKYKFLREETVYRQVWFYYFGIVEDFTLRHAWTVKLLLIELGYVNSDIILTCFSCFEVIRRFIWNFLRLENEQVNNIGRFRAVRDISIAPPQDHSDQVVIIRMMDVENGVVNRKNRPKKMTGQVSLFLDLPQGN